MRGAHGKVDGRESLGLPDLALILLLVVFVRFFSGAERRTFLHTPDSEFYLSLGAFGNDITDRAPNDLYYWTKLGIILPARALTYVLEASAALNALHFFLLLMLTASAYRAARIGFPRSMSCVAALFVSLNTVVLGFLGDPYATGAAVSLLAALYSCALVWMVERAVGGWVLPAAMGAMAAWLVMINPYAAFLGGIGVFGISLANLPAFACATISGVIRSFGSFFAAFAASIATFLAAGSVVFPGMNWFETLRDFSSNSDPSIWAEPNWTWLATETSLLVPAISAMVAGLALWLDPRSPLARSGAALAGLVPLAAIGFKVATQGNGLETSLYSALLWPSALLGLVAGIASRASSWRSTYLGMVLLVLCPTTWIALGHWSGTATPTLIGFVCSGTCLVVGATMVTSGGRTPVESHSIAWTARSTLGLIPLLALGSVFQLLQNGRPGYSESIHPRVEYESAFLRNASGLTQERDLEVQTWLVSKTGSDDSVLVWAEPTAISTAAMQLWGPNTAGSADGGLGEAGLATVQSVQPTVFATYSSTQGRADALSDELASQWTLDDRQCRDFSAAGLPDLVVCLNFLGNPLAALTNVTSGSTGREVDAEGTSWYWLVEPTATIVTTRGSTEQGRQQVEFSLQPPPCATEATVRVVGPASDETVTVSRAGEQVVVPVSTADTTELKIFVLSDSCTIQGGQDARTFYAGLFNLSTQDETGD